MIAAVERFCAEHKSVLIDVAAVASVLLLTSAAVVAVVVAIVKAWLWIVG